MNYLQHVTTKSLLVCHSPELDKVSPDKSKKKNHTPVKLLTMLHIRFMQPNSHLKLTYPRRHHSLIVIRVHTDAVTLQIKGKLTVLDMFQLVLVKIWPPP